MECYESQVQVHLYTASSNKKGYKCNILQGEVKSLSVKLYLHKQEMLSLSSSLLKQY